jgi:O-antigen ligase
MPAKICFILLFLLAFVIAPFGTTEFENPKVIIAEAGILFLIVYSLFAKKTVFHMTKKQLLFYGGIVFVTGIDLVFFRTNISFFGNVFRMQGIYLLWLLLLFSVVSKNVSFASVSWYWYGLLIILESVLVFFLPLNESQRFVGTLGEPNALGAFIIFLWPFAFFSIKRFRLFEKIGIAVVLLLVCMLLFLSGSKSALIAFILQLVGIVLYKKKVRIKTIVLVCVGIYGISYIFPFFEHIIYENRVEVWRSAINAGMMHPFVGSGFGNTEFALHQSAKQQGLPIQFYYVDSSHNIFLDWWVQGGIAGLLLLCGFVYQAGKHFIQTKNIRELMLFFGMLLVLSFNPASVVGLLAFWWLIGQGFKE